MNVMVQPNPINASTIKLRFPMFRRLDDAIIEYVIEEAIPDVDPVEFADRYVMALNNLVAHRLMIWVQRIESGTGQVIQSMNVGGEISFSYAAQEMPSKEEFLDYHTTPFGVRFLDLCDLCIPAVLII
jgi:uncharacterized protein DUF4054